MRALCETMEEPGKLEDCQDELATALARAGQAEKKLDELRPYSHEVVRAAVDWRDQRITELETELATLREVAQTISNSAEGWLPQSVLVSAPAIVALRELLEERITECTALPWHLHPWQV